MFETVSDVNQIDNVFKWIRLWKRIYQCQDDYQYEYTMPALVRYINNPILRIRRALLHKIPHNIISYKEMIIVSMSPSLIIIFHRKFNVADFSFWLYLKQRQSPKFLTLPDIRGGWKRN